MSKLADQYSEAINYGKSQLPDGEQCNGILWGVEEFSMVKKFLQQYVFGWLINSLSKQPRTYAIIYSDKTLIFVGFKQAVLMSTSYQPEFFFSRTVSEVSMKKGLGKYTLLSKNEDQKKVQLTVSSHGGVKADLEQLERLTSA